MSRTSIPHIEDLSAERLLDLLLNIDSATATEKLDGSQLLFGIDEHGFYTSRESKGGNRVYKLDDYPVEFSTTYQRHCHAVLEKCLTALVGAGFKLGDQVEVEVLYGYMPNVVPYSHTRSSVVLLRSPTNSVDISALAATVKNREILISMTVPETFNGKTISTFPDHTVWSIVEVPVVSIDTVALKSDLEPYIDDLQKLLARPSGISDLTLAEACKIPLNKTPAICQPGQWPTMKSTLKLLRLDYNQSLDKIRESVKCFLLGYYVDRRGSILGHPYNKGGWIEGVVLDYRGMVKVVDKKKFGAAREFIWRERNQLRSKPTSSAMIGFTDYVESMIKAAEDSALSLQTPVFADAQKMFNDVVDTAISTLSYRLDKYTNERDLYELAIPGLAKPVGYKEYTVNRRTLEVFALLRKQLVGLKDNINSATDFHTLMEAVAKR